jgi:hypothetical protein
MSETERETYRLEVEGEGAFVVRRREQRETLKILAEYSRITEGEEKPSPLLDVVADILSVLRVLVMEAPKGFDLDALDPFDDTDFKRMAVVAGAIGEKEAFFRHGPRATGQAESASTGGDTGVVAEADVSSPPDRPPLP